MSTGNAQEAARLFQEGIDHFNRGDFFEAHESWETLWLGAPEPHKTFLQGIIQVAAAFHHYSRGNLAGAQSLLCSGLAKLEQFPAHHSPLQLEHLRVAVRKWRAFLSPGNRELPALPKIQMRGTD